MRSSLTTVLILLSVLSVFAADTPDAPQAPPYVPDKDTQLQCIGGTKRPRFKVKDITWPARPGEAEICLWNDDKFAVLTITIDDNCRPDHTWWLAQAEQHGFKLTWFVITGGVGKNKGFSGVWEDWRKLHKAGHAIQSHTINHHKDDSKQPEETVRREYGGSKTILENNIPGNRCLTVAYPCGKGQYNVAKEYFIAGRGVRGTPNEPNKINYANTNSAHLSLDHVHAVLGRKAERVKWLNNPRYKRGWLSCHYHLVKHGKTAEQKKKSVEKCEKLLAKVAEDKDKLWFAAFPEAAKYGQERDTAELKVTGSDNKKITFTLTDRMRDDLFDFPLTIKVRLDDSWKTVKAVQDGKEIKAVYVEHEGKPYALVYAVPDRGEVTVTQ